MAEELVTEETFEVVVEVDEKEPGPMVVALRRVLMASIGVVAVAQDEIEDFVNRLIERGEIAEKDGRKLINDIVERRRTREEEVESELEGRIENILHRLNVPTKADIEALSEKITILTEKVDELK